jgi:hypothetical protein
MNRLFLVVLGFLAIPPVHRDLEQVQTGTSEYNLPIEHKTPLRKQGYSLGKERHNQTDKETTILHTHHR